MPDIGWEASLSNDFHDVSGTVSVVDADTLQFDDFTYDGGGLAVFFYLGAADTTADFANGLPIGMNFIGSVFDGTQPAFTLDLPTGRTIDGYHAISVWCTAVGVSFGSGTFLPPVQVPEPASLSLCLTAMLLATPMRHKKGARNLLWA